MHYKRYFSFNQAEIFHFFLQNYKSWLLVAGCRLLVACCWLLVACCLLRVFSFSRSSVGMHTIRISTLYHQNQTKVSFGICFSFDVGRSMFDVGRSSFARCLLLVAFSLDAQFNYPY
jgi:hypothetical protein